MINPGSHIFYSQLFSTVPGLRSMVNQSENPDAEAYDPRKRDPQFAHASSSPLWELVGYSPLSSHSKTEKFPYRPHCSTITTPQFHCTRGSSSPPSHSPPAPISHRTHSPISSIGSCTRIPKSSRRPRMRWARGSRKEPAPCNLQRAGWMVLVSS